MLYIKPCVKGNNLVLYHCNRNNSAISVLRKIIAEESRLIPLFSPSSRTRCWRTCAGRRRWMGCTSGQAGSSPCTNVPPTSPSPARPRRWPHTATRRYMDMIYCSVGVVHLFRNDGGESVFTQTHNEAVSVYSTGVLHALFM